MCGDVLTAEEVDNLFNMMNRPPATMPSEEDKQKILQNEYAGIERLIERFACRLYELNRITAERDGKGVSLVKDDHGNIVPWPFIDMELYQEVEDDYYFVAKSLLSELFS